MPHESANKGDARVRGIADELAIEIDANGSPVTIEAADWLVCFVPGLRKQWWHRFAHARHKHVFAIRMVDEDTWIVVEPWWTRLMVSVLSFDEAFKFLRWAAAGDIVKVREAIPGLGSQTRGWSNCTVLVSFLLGRSYRTWTPHGLYRKLVAESDARTVDVSQLLVEHFRSVAGESGSDMMEPSREHGTKPLENVLLRMGEGIAKAMMSPSAISLHQMAASGSNRFKDASDACWTHSPERAVRHIRQVLEEAQLRGEIRVGDCALAARQFVAMLRGDLQMEIIFGIKAAAPPAAGEIQAHVKSVVAVFLNGAGITARHGKAGQAHPGAQAAAART